LTHRLVRNFHHFRSIPGRRRKNVRIIGRGNNDAVDRGALAFIKAVCQSIGVRKAPVAVGSAGVGLGRLFYVFVARTRRRGHVGGYLVHH